MSIFLLALLMSPGWARSAPAKKEKVVDSRTFLRLVIAGARNEFAAYRGGSERKSPDGGVRRSGTLRMGGRENCVWSRTAQGDVSYGCTRFWMMDEKGASPECSAAYAEAGGQLRQELPDGWAVVEAMGLKGSPTTEASSPAGYMRVDISISHSRDTRLCRVSISGFRRSLR